MSRSLLPAIAALALSGCASAPVVKPEVVRITCPSVAPPPETAWAPAGPLADLRQYPEALARAEGLYAADRGLWAAYRETWQACTPR